MSENLKKMHREMDAFYSNGYLSTWCYTVRKEWTEFLDRAFSALIPTALEGQKDGLVLDIGCGPSISNVISASGWSSNIVLADYLASNRQEVERFRTDASDAFHWDHYFNFLGVLELNPDIGGIADRTRRAIRHVLFCDVTVEQVFEEDQSVIKAENVDVMIASLVLDVVAVNERMFTLALKNLLQYLRPGGLLVVQGSLGEHTYTVGSACFPVMNTDEAMLRKIFAECGLECLRWELCAKVTTHYFVILRKL